MTRPTLLSVPALLVSAVSAFAQTPTSNRPPAELYQLFCAACHGPQGQGGASGPSLTDTVWIYGSEEATVARLIRQGVLEKGMPGFGAALSDAEVSGLTQFVRGLSTGAIAKAPLASDDLKPEYASAQPFQVETYVSGVVTPWAMTWLPDGSLLVTEKGGKLRWVREGKLLPEPIKGTPEVDSGGQAGLFEVTLHPGYAQNGWIYLAYSKPGLTPKERNGSMTAIVRGRLRDNAWVDQETIWEAPAASYKNAGGVHFGGRIVFDRQGYLYFSHGERGAMNDAQSLFLPNGKIHRLHDDGRVPQDNPFVGTPGALPSIWSYGHRNPQGLAMDPRTGFLWETEHGPKGGDELNLVLPGRNYGWPVISYGINYDGSVLTPYTEKEGMEQPQIQWTPSIAVAGIAFYTGDLFPAWKGSLLVGSLAKQELRRIVIEQDRAVGQELILKNIGNIRSISVGPDGAVYLALNREDRIARLVPKR